MTPYAAGVMVARPWTLGAESIHQYDATRKLLLALRAACAAPDVWARACRVKPGVDWLPVDTYYSVLWRARPDCDDSVVLEDAYREIVTAIYTRFPARVRRPVRRPTQRDALAIVDIAIAKTTMRLTRAVAVRLTETA